MGLLPTFSIAAGEKLKEETDFVELEKMVLLIKQLSNSPQLVWSSFVAR